MTTQRRTKPQRVLRQRGRRRADGLRARELGEAAGPRAAEGFALVHACGLGLGHVGFVSLGAVAGAALADEDGEEEEGEGEEAGGADGDADFGAEGEGGLFGWREGVAGGENLVGDEGG